MPGPTRFDYISKVGFVSRLMETAIALKMHGQCEYLSLTAKSGQTKAGMQYQHDGTPEGCG
jgi:hypothetical protein